MGRDGRRAQEKTWGEEHYPDGRKHKYGNSSDGSQYWDEWEDGDGGWWEVMSSFGWHEAIGHSPFLMDVPLQPRKGGGAGAAKGRGDVAIITPHREAGEGWSESAVFHPPARALERRRLRDVSVPGHVVFCDAR